MRRGGDLRQIGGSARVIRGLIDHSAHHSDKGQEDRPPENGGRLAFAERRRRSSIQAGMAPASAPAIRHSRAADRASGSSGSPSLVPSKRPATWASRSARYPASAWSSASGRLLVLGERAPPGAMPGLAGQLSHHNPVGISPGTILVHLARIEHVYVKGNLISGNNIHSGSLCAQSQGAASTAAAGRGLLEVLAGVLIACGRVRQGQVSGDAGRADGGQGGRAEGLSADGDAAGLAGDALGEQLDGEASVEPDNTSSNRPCSPVRHHLATRYDRLTVQQVPGGSVCDGSLTAARPGGRPSASQARISLPGASVRSLW